MDSNLLAVLIFLIILASYSAAPQALEIGKITGVWKNVRIRFETVARQQDRVFETRNFIPLAVNYDGLLLTCDGSDAFKAPCQCVLESNFGKILVVNSFQIEVPCAINVAAYGNETIPQYFWCDTTDYDYDYDGFCTIVDKEVAIQILKDFFSKVDPINAKGLLPGSTCVFSGLSGVQKIALSASRIVGLDSVSTFVVEIPELKVTCNAELNVNPVATIQLITEVLAKEPNVTCEIANGVTSIIADVNSLANIYARSGFDSAKLASLVGCMPIALPVPIKVSGIKIGGGLG